jgi:hypothetical protein
MYAEIQNMRGHDFTIYNFVQVDEKLVNNGKALTSVTGCYAH